MLETTMYHLTAEKKPFCLTSREIGCVNIGVYCANASCGEFLTILKEQNPDLIYGVVLKQPILVRCDYCQHEDRYPQDSIEHISLNPQNIKRLVQKP